MNPEFLALAADEAWSKGVLIVAAHPDDETLGAGGVLPHLPLLAIAHVTDGAPADPRWWGDPAFRSRDEYAYARRVELNRALELAAIPPGRDRALGYRDQRAMHHLADIADDVARLIDELRPGVVLTHSYEGGHPDHDAAAFAVHAARELAGGNAPAVVELALYHADEKGIATGDFLPGDADVVSIPLSRVDQERKRRMLACFATQAATVALFPELGVERFRRAPEYDFTQPPHAGTLYYERFDFGITGAEWRALAAGALDALGIGAAR